MIKKIKREISRRKLLKGAAGIAATTLAASALPKPAISQGLKKVKFQLAWLPTGGNAFSLMAKQLGYWEKRGLDVEVPRGFGSGAATQAVAAKQTDITLAATGTAILGVIKDLPLICTATGGYDSTMGIAVAPNSGIKSPKDLEGKNWNRGDLRRGAICAPVLRQGRHRQEQDHPSVAGCQGARAGIDIRAGRRNFHLRDQ